MTSQIMPQLRHYLACSLVLLGFSGGSLWVVGDVFDEPEETRAHTVLLQDSLAKNSVPLHNQDGTTAFPSSSTLLAKPLRIEDFYIELVLCSLLVLYVFIYQWGKHKNEQIAKTWIKYHLDLFASHFAHVGNDKGHILVKDGPADFLFYASGRIHCQYLRARLQMIPRHDPVALLIGFIRPQYDRISIEVCMNEDEYDPVVFGVATASKVTAAYKYRYDLASFTRQVRTPLLPDNFYALTEHGDITTTILDDNISEVIKSHRDYFEEMYITDQPSKKPETVTEIPPKLFFNFRLPSPAHMETIIGLHELVLYMIDHLPQVAHFRGPVKTKLLNTREVLTENIRKASEPSTEEAASKKRQEQRQLEQERLGKMTPEQQRKWEEKEHKRQLKKRQSKMIKRR
ncbi:hypothetical protein BDF19DRAFT_444730 [Syncephalis fuscata]|nr:hypothetical protein BDF19DRAFT_444730 [Syncephalis fuscata]